MDSEAIEWARLVVRNDIGLARGQHMLLRAKELGDPTMIAECEQVIGKFQDLLARTLEQFLATQPDAAELHTEDGQVLRAYEVARTK